MMIVPRQRVAVRVATAGTVAVGGLAFALSFTALSDLASHVGVTPGQEWMVPLVIDGGIIVATMATVALTRHGWYAWTLLILSSLVSVAGNVVHAGPHGPIAMAVAAIPPLWLLASTHLTVLLYRETRESRLEAISEPRFTRGFAENAA
ncbi:membrane protein [Mycobacterium phage Commander]|uniref:Membrane protein n=1 Tax=Mycobacterium phage Commander TaxID=2250400 RepID=A0A345KQX5_9CAUD|nr:membrane protein [Mycobacterium phage Commander]